MANNCMFQCRIVGKSKEHVQQFVDALNYRDLKNGYFTCRVFSADADKIRKNKDLYCVDVSGDCAWSVDCCMIGKGYGEMHGIRYGEPEFSVWRSGINGSIHYANIGVTIPELCEILDCGIEIWSQEPGEGFQEHYAINHHGDMTANATCDWNEPIPCEDGEENEGGTDEDPGGFDNWGEYEDDQMIFCGYDD